MVSPHDDHTGLRAPGFGGATGWLNGEPAALPGWADGPTLIEFFAYSCVNCLRGLPLLRAWHAAYAPHGLRLIGVHTPEFEFERDPANVARFLAEWGIAYPVALDAERRVWDRWANKFWPRRYLVDRAGVIRHDWIGEGGGHATESALRDLLAPGRGSPAPVLVLPETWCAPAGADDEATIGAFCVRPTRELFAGWYRGWPASPAGWREDTAHDYAPLEPADLPIGPLALGGRWRVEAERAVALPESGSPASATVRYVGFGANAVLGPPEGASSGEVAVTLDGRPLRADERGADVVLTADGVTRCRVEAPRLYRLTATAEPGPHTLTLQVTAEAPVNLYSLTFEGCELTSPRG